MSWTVLLLDEIEEWFLDLAKHDQETASLVAAAIDLLAESRREEWLDGRR